MKALRALGTVLLSFVAACGSEGTVTITVRTPSVAVLNPVSSDLTEYQLIGPDSMVLGVAPVTSTGATQLSLGTLQSSAAPEEVSLSLLSGTQLEGMARLRSVVIKNATKSSYEANVRKPLLFVGQAAPPELTTGGVTTYGSIIDPTALISSTDIVSFTSSPDLSHPLGFGTTSPAGALVLPDGTGATTVTWDGRFLISAGTSGLQVTDTGSWNSVGGAIQTVNKISRLVAAPRDQAIAALSRDGEAVMLWTDVPGLTSGQVTQPILVPLNGEIPRSAAFSSDGTKLYVLSGGDVLDPCDGSTLTTNKILTVDLTGQIVATANLNDFAADLALDDLTGALIVSLPITGQVATVDLSSNPIGTKKLFDAGCTSAVRAGKGQVFAVTTVLEPAGTLHASTNCILKIASLQNGTERDLPFDTPFYSPTLAITDDSDTLAGIQLTVQATSVNAYEMVLTPDGSRAIFATRAHYNQVGKELGFNFSPSTGLPQSECSLDVDVVEYGLYNIDLHSGATHYDVHSQFVIGGATGKCDLLCGNNAADTNAFKGSCAADDINDSTSPHDEPFGLSALFGVQ